MRVLISNENCYASVWFFYVNSVLVMEDAIPLQLTKCRLFSRPARCDSAVTSQNIATHAVLRQSCVGRRFKRSSATIHIQAFNYFCVVDSIILCIQTERGTFLKLNGELRLEMTHLACLYIFLRVCRFFGPMRLLILNVGNLWDIYNSVVSPLLSMSTVMWEKKHIVMEFHLNKSTSDASILHIYMIIQILQHLPLL